MLGLPLIILIACGGSESAPEEQDFERHEVASSCNLIGAVGYCLDFDERAPKNAAFDNCLNAQNQTGIAGAATDAPCPTENRVGTCTARREGDYTQVIRYYPPKYDFGKARDHCSRVAGGTATFAEE